MKLLAWDTSSKTGAIAALEWDEGPAPRESARLACEWSLSVDSRHSERLLWGIHQVLEASRWRLGEVDVFAVGAGPGSFTGLRIGLATARTLAHALGKPLVGVSSLAALALPAASWLRGVGLGRSLVVAATDACKGELFARWGSASSRCQERVLAPEALVSGIRGKLALASPHPRRWLAVGEGRRRYPEAWRKLPASLEIRPEIPFPDQVQGRALAILALEAWEAGLGRPALEIRPRYLRASDAEVKLESGALRRAPMEPPRERR